MVHEMQWTDMDLLLQINEEHKKLNGKLRVENSELSVENKLLRETAQELYDVMSNIEFSAQKLFKYDEMPWVKWEAVVYKEPYQLKLF